MRKRSVRKRARFQIRCRAEVGKGAFLIPIEDAGLDEQLQMARDARLRLPADLDEVRDGEIGCRQKTHEPQPRRLSQRLQEVDRPIEKHRNILTSHIRMSLYAGRLTIKPLTLKRRVAGEH